MEKERNLKDFVERKFWKNVEVENVGKEGNAKGKEILEMMEKFKVERNKRNHISDMKEKWKVWKESGCGIGDCEARSEVPIYFKVKQPKYFLILRKEVMEFLGKC